MIFYSHVGVMSLQFSRVTHATNRVRYIMQKPTLCSRKQSRLHHLGYRYVSLILFNNVKDTNTLHECGNIPNIKPTIWAWYLLRIYSNMGDGNIIGFLRFISCRKMLAGWQKKLTHKWMGSNKKRDRHHQNIGV